MTQYSFAALRAAHSFLFVPGDRPERFAKAANSGADAIVLDLEDAVSPGNKADARRNVERWLQAGNAATVRINGIQTDWHEDDLAMVAAYRAPTMLPKTETSDALAEIAECTSGVTLLPLIETSTGILAAQSICLAEGVARVAFGSLDLAAELSVDPSDREALSHSRSMLVLASAAASLAPPIDGVTSDLSDLEHTREDYQYAKRLGLSAKLCIHPSQVQIVNQAAAPTPEDVIWAQRVLEASANNDSVQLIDGEMVDRPVTERARAILRKASQGSSHLAAQDRSTS